MTGMEYVLAAHSETYTSHMAGRSYVGCSCGWDSEASPNAHAAHVAQALQAAGFGNLHDAWVEVTANSPRLPNNLRELVFDAVGDVIDKFQFPVQNLGIHPTAVELGDVCGDVEKRVLAIIRAAATYPKVSET